MFFGEKMRYAQSENGKPASYGPGAARERAAVNIGFGYRFFRNGGYLDRHCSLCGEY